MLLGRLHHARPRQAVGEANPTLQDVLEASPSTAAYRRMSSAGCGDSKVPDLWHEKEDVGQRIKQPWEGIAAALVPRCSTELLALTAPLSSAGLRDELQRQVCFVLLWPLQVGLSLGQECSQIVNWEGGLARAWAAAGATLLTVEQPPHASQCKGRHLHLAQQRLAAGDITG